MDFLYFFLQTDKQKHLIISLLLLGLFLFLRRVILKRKGFLKELSFSLRDTLAIGILKEVIDLFGFGKPELLDIFADFFGILVIFYIYFLFIEGKHLEENNKFFRSEINLINEIKTSFGKLVSRLFLYIKINYKVIFYKRKILYYIPQKTRKFLLKRSLFDFFSILENTLLLSLIWFINLIILIIKIPFTAFYEATNGIVWMIKYSFDFKKSDLRNI